MEYSFTLCEYVTAIGIIKKLNSQQLGRIFRAERLLERRKTESEEQHEPGAAHRVIEMGSFKL